MALKCVAHYESPKYDYSELIVLSPNAHARLLQAKQVRRQQGGNNAHREQAALIPDHIDPNIHGIHMEPCYKKFTLIISQLKRNQFDDGNPSTSKQLRSTSQSTASTNLFPDYCYFCKMKRKKVRGKEQISHKLTLASSEQMIKRAAEESDDIDVLRDIQGVDLLAKEFQVHDKCRLDYIRKVGVTKPSTSSKEDDIGNFELVKMEIQSTIIENNKAISMKVIHELYNDGHDGDTRYRSKLKQRILKEFPDLLYFLKIDNNNPEVVVSKEGIESMTTPNEKSFVVRKAAEFIREDILKFCDETKDSQWPPSIQELQERNQEIPESVLSFLENLLKTPGHACSEKVKRYIQSYSSDLVHGVTQGKCLMLKHYLLGVGLHNLTGQKNPIRILSNFGHSTDYKSVCQIETAQAEIAQLLYDEDTSPGLKPSSDDSYVFTYFWADNFNKKIESDSIGMIDSTHMIKFQEHSDDTVMERTVMSLEKRSTKFTIENSDEIEVRIDAKKEPAKLSQTEESETKEGDDRLQNLELQYTVWMVLRMMTSKQDRFSTFAAWQLMLRKAVAFSCQEKSVVTYLPPINAPVTSFTTVFRYLSYMQKLCIEVNMPFVNVTLDVGAAMNAFKVVWNYPETFRNVVIHLGDFHLMKEMFSILGLLVKGSGFEEIIFQSGLCTSGSLNGVLAGSHYNRCWKIHEHFAEALERLLLQRFVADNDCKINEVISRSQILDATEGVAGSVFTSQTTKDFEHKYETFKQDVRQGKLGKTAQFWLINYLDVMHILHALHIAVHESSYELRLKAWKEILPYFFSLDRTNYSRYGSYYVCQLQAMDTLFPGCKGLLKHYGISVQGQDRYPLRTAVDQRGEQTLNRDAKTSGGITNFAGNIESVTKWTLNRSSQAEITKELKSAAGLEDANDTYKPLRPRQVVKSGKLANTLVSTISEDFVSPFSQSLSLDKLYNLASGIPVDDYLAHGMLQIPEIGRNAHAKFVSERIMSDEKGIHDKLPRMKVKLFKQCSQKVMVKKHGKMKTVEANRNIISTLLAASAKTQQAIDFESALQFPLSPVPLNISNADGSRRTTDKSKLAKIIMKKTTVLNHSTEMPAKQDVTAYIVDLMALVRVQRSTPNTYEELAMQIVHCIPSGYRHVHIVADTYRPQSIKDPERLKRGCTDKVIVHSAAARLPRNFTEFLKNGENKTRLINLIQEVVIARKAEVLAILRSDTLFYSNDNVCHVITKDSVTVSCELSSNQEEADTKLALHASYALKSDPNGTVIIRNHSGDVDINVIIIALITDECERVVIDFNTGNHRQAFRLSDVDMSPEEKASLLGFHAFTGNDYISAFFQKGKTACWNILRDNPRFWQVFGDLGTEWLPSESLTQQLEEFVCLLFGSRRLKSVNTLRFQTFKRKYESENRIIDLSLLPPCRSSLYLHILRSCYVARIWRLSLTSCPQLPAVESHGWTENNQVKWIEAAFPDDVASILLTDGLEEEDFAERSDESDESDSEDD